MGKIDDHAKRLPLVDTLHSSRDTGHLCQPLDNVIRCHTQTIRGGNRSQAVAHVESSHQLRFNHHLSSGKNQVEARAMSMKLYVHCSNCSRSVYAIVQNRHATVLLQHVIARVIAIENGSGAYSQPFVSRRIKTFKKTRFSTKVRFHSLMKIKMLMRKVCHDTYIKIAPGNSMQL